jgi:hypothetical protein
MGRLHVEVESGSVAASAHLVVTAVKSSVRYRRQVKCYSPVAGTVSLIKMSEGLDRCAVRHCRALPQLQKDLKKGSLAVAFQPSNALCSAVRRASIGDHLHLAVGCRVYPNLSSSLPHLDFVRKGACSAEALESRRQKLGLEAERPVGFCGDRQCCPDPDEQLIRERESARENRSLIESMRRSEIFITVHLMEGDSRGPLVRGFGWLRERGATRIRQGSEHQPDVHLIVEKTSGPELLPLSHVYSHCAKSAHATVQQTIQIW